MRFQAPVVLGLAIFLGGITGCASSRQSGRSPGVEEVLAAPSTLPTTYPTDYAHPQTAGQGSDPFRFSHPRVDNYKDRFQNDLRGFFSGALSRSGKYVPRMISILEKEGVPTELVYLPLIESGYRNQAVSPAGAVGPWQFIPGTGRRYGLRIDSYVDERRDPVKSTRAAARYLRDLHDMFGDWHLSLAAYNTGEGRISRILASGLAADFWEMSENGYLYRETEAYVPEFLAAVQIADDPEAHGFDSPEWETIEYDVVSLKSSIQLATIARLCRAPLQEVRDLNPALTRGVVPPSGYTIRLPKGHKDIFQVALVDYEEEMRELAQRQRAEAAARRAACRSKGKGCNVRGKSVASPRRAVASTAKPGAKRQAVASAKKVTTTKTAAVAKRGKSTQTVASSKSGRGQKPASKAVASAKRPAKKSATVSKAAAARKPAAVRAAAKPAQKKPAPIVTASRKNNRRAVD